MSTATRAPQGDREERRWTPLSEVPCKFFAKGWCANGSECKFSHAKSQGYNRQQQQQREQPQHRAPPVDPSKIERLPDGRYVVAVKRPVRAIRGVVQPTEHYVQVNIQDPQQQKAPHSSASSSAAPSSAISSTSSSPTSSTVPVPASSLPSSASIASGVSSRGAKLPAPTSQSRGSSVAQPASSAAASADFPVLGATAPNGGRAPAASNGVASGRSWAAAASAGIPKAAPPPPPVQPAHEQHAHRAQQPSRSPQQPARAAPAAPPAVSLDANGHANGLPNGLPNGHGSAPPSSAPSSSSGLPPRPSPTTAATVAAAVAASAKKPPQPPARASPVAPIEVSEPPAAPANAASTAATTPVVTAPSSPVVSPKSTPVALPFDRLPQAQQAQQPAPAAAQPDGPAPPPPPAAWSPYGLPPFTLPPPHAMAPYPPPESFDPNAVPHAYILYHPAPGWPLVPPPPGAPSAPGSAPPAPGSAQQAPGNPAGPYALPLGPILFADPSFYGAPGGPGPASPFVHPSALVPYPPPPPPPAPADGMGEAAAPGSPPQQPQPPPAGPDQAAPPAAPSSAAPPQHPGYYPYFAGGYFPAYPPPPFSPYGAAFGAYPPGALPYPAPQDPPASPRAAGQPPRETEPPPLPAPPAAPPLPPPLPPAPAPVAQPEPRHVPPAAAAPPLLDDPAVIAAGMGYPPPSPSPVGGAAANLPSHLLDSDEEEQQRQRLAIAAGVEGGDASPPTQPRRPADPLVLSAQEQAEADEAFAEFILETQGGGASARGGRGGLKRGGAMATPRGGGGPHTPRRGARAGGVVGRDGPMPGAFSGPYGPAAFGYEAEAYGGPQQQQQQQGRPGYMENPYAQGPDFYYYGAPGTFDGPLDENGFPASGGFYYETGVPRPMDEPLVQYFGATYRDVAAPEDGGYSNPMAHAIPHHPAQDRSKLQSLCRYHTEADGKCRYPAAACRFVHGKACPVCRRNCLWPDDRPENEEHVRACRKARGEGGAPPGPNECGICYERVKGRFGLLNNCEHAFCLDCIREWRGTDGQARTATKACPLCRTESHFVVPSDRFLGEGPEKAALVEAFRGNTAKIPCKWFDRGRGACPFGSSCFYAHLNPDGTPAAPAELRLCQNAEGAVGVVRPVKLSDFLAGH